MNVLNGRRDRIDMFMPSTINPKGSALENQLRNITRTYDKNTNKKRKSVVP